MSAVARTSRNPGQVGRAIPCDAPKPRPFEWKVGADTKLMAAAFVLERAVLPPRGFSRRQFRACYTRPVRLEGRGRVVLTADPGADPPAPTPAAGAATTSLSAARRAATRQMPLTDGSEHGRGGCGVESTADAPGARLPPPPPLINE